MIENLPVCTDNTEIKIESSYIMFMLLIWQF